MKKFLFSILLIIVILWSASLILKESNIFSMDANGESLENQVKSFASKPFLLAKIGSTPIILQEAVTGYERTLGLSGRASLPKDQGLFFVFEHPDFNYIWMKDMKFSIDILWLDSNFKITDIVEDATPQSFPNSFAPKEKSYYVLEVNSGFVRRNGIKIGDALEI
ncbi:MAG: DUF192 domain-containing protein [Candidatus Taylorbacteria bacterium]